MISKDVTDNVTDQEWKSVTVIIQVQGSHNKHQKKKNSTVTVILCSQLALLDSAATAELLEIAFNLSY